MFQRKLSVVAGMSGGELLGAQLNHWVSALRRQLGTPRPFVCLELETDPKNRNPTLLFSSLPYYPLLSPFLFPTVLSYLHH